MKIRKQTIFRKWNQEGERDSEHYLIIKPNDEMIEFASSRDAVGKKFLIFKTHKRHQMNTEIFIKYKEVAKKSEVSNEVMFLIEMLEDIYKENKL